MAEAVFPVDAGNIIDSGYVNMECQDADTTTVNLINDNEDDVFIDDEHTKTTTTTTTTSRSSSDTNRPINNVINKIFRSPQARAD